MFGIPQIKERLQDNLPDIPDSWMSIETRNRRTHTPEALRFFLYYYKEHPFDHNNLNLAEARKSNPLFFKTDLMKQLSALNLKSTKDAEVFLSQQLPSLNDYFQVKKPFLKFRHHLIEEQGIVKSSSQVLFRNTPNYWFGVSIRPERTSFDTERYERYLHTTSHPVSNISVILLVWVRYSILKNKENQFEIYIDEVQSDIGCFDDKPIPDILYEYAVTRFLVYAMKNYRIFNFHWPTITTKRNWYTAYIGDKKVQHLYDKLPKKFGFTKGERFFTLKVT